MRLRLGAFPRYRPRVLTVVVLVVIATLIVPANLSDDVRSRSISKTPAVALATGHRRSRLSGERLGLAVECQPIGWQSSNRYRCLKVNSAASSN